VAGVNGTLQFTFKGTKLENNLRAKTGSMTRVKSLAGIFTNQEGRKIIFALIANNFEGTQTTVRGLIESFLMEIYESKYSESKR
jgi:D-alanyl-D-alanine carboxypeptidase/D-alanyl-D-alanine-endopeptidase (penicillin-binding protein 4)